VGDGVGFGVGSGVGGGVGAALLFLTKKIFFLKNT